MRNTKPIKANRKAKKIARSKLSEFSTLQRSPSTSTIPNTTSLPPEPERPRGEPSTPLSLYMREVGEVPLLTPEQEIQLAARIKKGDEQARDHMIRANLRLVVKIARQYEGLGLPLLDLINEGNLGLMKAVERFDPAKGGKLSTYGSWWIKQNMRRALANQAKTIRLPIYVVDQIYHLSRVSMKLAELFGREPSDEELAAEMDLSVARIAELRNAAMRPVSLDAPMGDDDTSRLSDVVPDDNVVMPDEQLDGRSLTRIIRELIKKLHPREATILSYRFGLDGGNEKTLEEVGAKFGVTRERIRQLQNSSLLKLRKMLKQMDSIALPA